MANYGCACIFFGLVPWFLLWRLFRWMGHKAGYHGDLVPLTLASVVVIALCVWVFRKLAQEMGRQKKRGASASDDLVEEWHITSSRVLELVPLGDDDPVLCFEAGPGRIVMLKGQWLRDESIYGAPRIKDDPHENFLNGLGSPFSFPSREFVVVRWPGSARVLSIRPAAGYLAPEPSKIRIKRDYYFRDSETFNGDLDQLQQVLDAEAQKNKAGPATGSSR
ncbi:MAG TPA: hypothetical protein VK815_18435 [Candidatus Acidoferrales bacterium]|nr:hypothetical protein [Candidatus Acidoferrales bacterium]